MTSGSALLSILQGEDMTLTIAVDELDVVSVEPGQKVIITVDALTDLEVEGVVQKVAPVGSGESGVTTYDVKLSFDAAGTGIKAGMNATGEVQVAHVDDALYIPVKALMTVNDQYCVLTSSGGSTGSYQTVEVGLMNDDYAEILSGLNEGQAVLYESTSSSSSGSMTVNLGGMTMMTGGSTGGNRGGDSSSRSRSNGGMPDGMPAGMPGGF